MRNDSSQLAGLRAGLAIGLFFFVAHVVKTKIYLLRGDGLLSLVCISWAVVSVATLFVSAIYFRKKIEIAESNYLEERCFLNDQMKEVEGQLKSITEENSRLQQTINSFDQDSKFRKNDPSLVIDSDTYNRIYRAIFAFPTRYPEYANKPPKLENDVRPWLKEVDIAMNDREAIVFSTIISEHFNF